MKDNDKQAVQIVGVLCVGLGVAQLIFTLLITVFAVFAGVSSDFGGILAGLLAFGLSLAMSSALMNCGSQLAQVSKPGPTDTQALRMNWTALVLIMIIGIIPGAWLSPYLSVLALFVLLFLVAIRDNIRRLTD